MVIADRRPVLVVERLVVRCDECVRQTSVYISGAVGADVLGEQLGNVGWSVNDANEHYCPEHSEDS